jgi:indolepyruvate ferredoxin oxidoreductase beta subunit
MTKIFNLIICGYGGQGVLTLAEIISRAALEENYKVTESELHGLAQRGGPLDCHIRMGKNQEFFSPLIRRGEADLIIALDLLEAWRACYFANKKKTKIISNEEIGFLGKWQGTDKKQMISQIKKNSQEQEFIEATKIVKENVGIIGPLNIFMLSQALKKNYLPLKRETVWRVIEERLKGKNLEINKKVFYWGQTPKTDR